VCLSACITKIAPA